MECPPGSALHLPVSIGTAGSGVPPGSALHPQVSIASAAGDGGLGLGFIPSSLHWCSRWWSVHAPWFSFTPSSLPTAGGGMPPDSALHLPVPAGAAGDGGPSFQLPINTGVFPSVSTSGSASSILEYLPLYASMNSSAHGKYY